MHPKLLKKAEMVAIGTERTEPVTAPGEYPPCFESVIQYHLWADRAIEAPVLRRDDFPKEPNYCRDCHAAGKAKMEREGRCIFPETRFKENGEGEDLEIIGYTPRMRA